jgi:hypothetical protein
VPGELRAPYVVVDPLAEGDSNVRSPYITSEPLAEGSPAVRVSFLEAEPLAEGSPNLRANYVAVEPLSEGFRNLRCCFLCVESLIPVEPEGTVSTELFPGSLGSPASLPGLAFSVHKRPRFATGNHQASSGVGVRVAYMEYPIWEFELTYEFLIDSATDLQSQFKTLLGFFLSRHGGFDTFLLKDADDYLVENGALGTADGVTTQFPFLRYMGGFPELVGQVDDAATITLYGSIEEASAIPATPGPYTITAAHAADFVEDLGVTKGGIPLTRVPGAPAASQYSVNELTGVYTFNATDQGDAVILSYRYELAPADYTVTLPNLVIFDSAPADGMLISADFEFYFNCKFQEDIADFEKFAADFWQLQQIVLETVPQ